MTSKNKIVLIRNGILSLLFIAGLVFLFLFYWDKMHDVIKNTESFRNFILSYGYKGSLVFIGFQILHIIIPIIPGELVQIAGGYIYGTAIGTLYLIIGSIIGTFLVFYAVRAIGYPIVRVLVKEETINKFHAILTNKKSDLIVFILFIIPGIPKDALLYIGALTPVNPLRFILISLAARLPGLIGSAFIGSNIQQKDYTPVIVVTGISLLLVCIGLIFRKKIVNSLN